MGDPSENRSFAVMAAVLMVACTLLMVVPSEESDAAAPTVSEGYIVNISMDDYDRVFPEAPVHVHMDAYDDVFVLANVNTRIVQWTVTLDGDPADYEGWSLRGTIYKSTIGDVNPLSGSIYFDFTGTEATGTIYVDGSDLSGNLGTEYVYFHWMLNTGEDINQSQTGIYTIHYERGQSATYSWEMHRNSGSGDSETETSEQISELFADDEDVVLTAPESPFQVEGRTFCGWTTDAAGEGTLYRPGEPIADYGDCVLYAQYDVTHQVSFVSEGNAFVSERVADGGTVDERFMDGREGYAFVGWYTDTSWTTRWDFDAPVLDDMSLYARWEPEPWYESYPVPVFSVSMVEGTQLNVLFDASETRDWESLSWDFGDGETSEGVEIQHQYDHPGRYVVTLTATNDQGSVSFTDIVTVENGSVSMDNGGSAEDDGDGGRDILPIAVVVAAGIVLLIAIVVVVRIA